MPNPRILSELFFKSLCRSKQVRFEAGEKTETATLARGLTRSLYRPSLEALLEDYWRLMPEYQNVKLEQLEVLRILFGFFPTYRWLSLFSLQT